MPRSHCFLKTLQRGSGSPSSRVLGAPRLSFHAQVFSAQIVSYKALEIRGNRASIQRIRKIRYGAPAYFGHCSRRSSKSRNAKLHCVDDGNTEAFIQRRKNESLGIHNQGGK